MDNKKFIDKLLNLIFLEDKVKVYVIILFLIGIFLRLVAAHNLGLSADDSVHAIRPINIMESGRLSEYGQSSILWYYIQEVFYKILGTSQIGSRMATVVFGSLLIILMFLFVKKIFKSEKAGLIASALTAFSPFLIKMTLPEMDVAVMFFVILSGLFIFRFIESLKKKDLLIAAGIMGLAIMIKVYALFFAFSYVLFLAYSFRKKSESWKKVIKIAFIFSIILFIFIIPVITFNYLLYKDKGFMDLMFTTYFKLGMDKAEKLYSWNAGWGATADIIGFFLGKQSNFGGENAVGINRLPGFIVILVQIFQMDPLVMIFGLLGLILMFKRNKNYSIFFFFYLFLYILEQESQ
jgi:4-amino-4-deoxy-L-arabinose transferase-like glycosyltransferase